MSESRSDTNIWRLEVPVGGAATPPAVRLIPSSVIDSNPQYSPDGKRIAFESNRSGRGTIWICGQDGTRCFELEAIQMTYAGSPRWSPDGKQIAFDGRKDGAFEVYVLNVEGGAPRLLTGAPPDNSIPSWSHDGNWIYFRSARTGRNEIWKAPSAGGPAVQVTRNGGHVAFESPDGKSLYYTKSQTASKLWQLALGGTEERVVAEEVAWRAFAVAADRIYYVRPSPDGLPILISLFLATGKVSIITRLPQPMMAGLSLSPDGRYLLYSQIDGSSADLTLLEGFR
jgi:dipeptidyl aminopeptidase/acylaminoacyl peptidase